MESLAPFEITRIIPILRIFSLEKAEEFYVTYLGFTIDWTHRFDGAGPAYLQVSRGPLALHLTEHHGDCCPGSTVFVWVTGLHDLHQELQAKAYPYLNPGIGPAPWGGLCMELTDPFGNRLRLAERASGP